MLALFNFGAGGIPLLLFMLAFALFWMWMLISAIQNKGLAEGEKVGWVLAIVLLTFMGALLYLIIGRPKRLTPRPGT
jgi:hypothetical protein